MRRLHDARYVLCYVLVSCPSDRLMRFFQYADVLIFDFFFTASELAQPLDIHAQMEKKLRM